MWASAPEGVLLYNVDSLAAGCGAVYLDALSSP